MKFLMMLAVTAFAIAAARAELRSRAVEYKEGDATLEGYLVYDDAFHGTRPGVLVIHDWMGVGAYVKSRADQLARLGYVAFAADIYGKDDRPANSQQAAALSGKFKADRKLLRARANAALEVLRKSEPADPARIAAIGYCFGGTAVIELARSGADIAGVVSFHGGLDSPNPADGKNIKAKVLALQGADDPLVPAADIAAFEDEMRKGRVDWQFVAYGGAVHSFTRPDAGNDNSKGTAYNARADRRSWEAMKAFFAEIFHQGG